VSPMFKSHFIKETNRRYSASWISRGNAAEIATKRNISVTVRVPPVRKARSQATTHFITIDDVDSFAKVRKIKSQAKRLPASMSERQFNDGVKAIIGETGTFKDWGGETSDL
jgi:hypothetical protein